MDCHDFASAKSRNDACFSSSRILGIAVLLVLFFTNFLKKPASASPCTAVAGFERELDLRSAVLSKQGIPLAARRCFFRKFVKSVQ